MVEILTYSWSTSKMKPRISTWVSHNSSSCATRAQQCISAWDLQRRGLHPHHWPQSCSILSLAQSNTNKWSCPIAWIWISNLKLHLHSSQSVPNLQFPDILHPQVGHGICLIAMRQVERTIKIYSFWPCPILCLERPHLLHRTLKSTWDQQTSLSEPVKAPAQDNSPIYGKLGHRPLARSTDIGLDKIKQ
jgi:hypothetical protein